MALENICKHCKTTFKVYPSTQAKQYCSMACKSADKRVVYNCITCNAEFTAVHARKNVKYCSASCRQEGLKAKHETTCVECGKQFHLKESQRNKIKEPTCSYACMGKWRAKKFKGSGNPNFRNSAYDSDGYRTKWNDKTGQSLNEQIIEISLHRAVVAEILGVTKLPNNYSVHHRDCDHLNNESTNLVLLNRSDHLWLHKQFGNASLWAFCHGKVSLTDLSSWSDDPVRATHLLPLTIHEQIGDTFEEHCSE